MKTWIVLFAFIMASVTAACSSSNGDSGTPKDNPGAQAIDESVIQGSWKDACQSYGGGGYERSLENLISVVGADLTVTVNTFNNKTCSNSLSDMMKIKFTFEIPSRSNLDPNTFNLNLTLQSVTQIVFDQDAANAFNTVAHCGFTNWVVGVEKNITGLACISGLNSKTHSILKVSATSLQVGSPDNAHNGKTEAQRHVQLEAKVYSKVN